jgi:hypothetical protein
MELRHVDADDEIWRAGMGAEEEALPTNGMYSPKVVSSEPYIALA